MNVTDRFEKLVELVVQLPAVNGPAMTGVYDSGFWWVKFSIDIHHPLTWNLIQMLAYTINYLSISERLSTVFYPLAAPPLSGSNPEQNLYWLIESTSQDFSPNELATWLESRLPDAQNLEAWLLKD